MKLASKIFKRTDWYVTSKFGWRICPFHGKEFHAGTDYGTNNKKWPLYAIEDGYVQLIHYGLKGYGNYIWIRYPRLNISVLHAHLDKICVKNKDNVKEGTLIGYTGKTGTATGVHLHLGMTKIGSNVWLNSHEYEYKEKLDNEINNSKEKVYVVKKGDTLWNIAKKYYKDGKKYTKIAEKNNIKKPYTIYPNQKLIIP